MLRRKPIDSNSQVNPTSLSQQNLEFSFAQLISEYPQIIGIIGAQLKKTKELSFLKHGSQEQLTDKLNAACKVTNSYAIAEQKPDVIGFSKDGFSALPEALQRIGKQQNLQGVVVVLDINPFRQLGPLRYPATVLDRNQSWDCEYFTPEDPRKILAKPLMQQMVRLVNAEGICFSPIIVTDDVCGVHTKTFGIYDQQVYAESGYRFLDLPEVQQFLAADTGHLICEAFRIIKKDGAAYIDYTSSKITGTVEHL